MNTEEGRHAWIAKSSSYDVFTEAHVDKTTPRKRAGFRKRNHNKQILKTYRDDEFEWGVRLLNSTLPQFCASLTGKNSTWPQLSFNFSFSNPPQTWRRPCDNGTALAIDIWQTTVLQHTTEKISLNFDLPRISLLRNYTLNLPHSKLLRCSPDFR